MDPIEVARLDAEDGGDRWMDVLAQWSEEELRAFRAERERIRPAAGPTPWRIATVQLIATAATAELALALDRRSRSAAWAAVPAAAGILVPFDNWVEKADRAAARRRGVEVAGEGPPRPPMWPGIAVSVGAQLMRRKRGWLRERPGEAAAWAIAYGVVSELDDRWRWRKFPVIRA